MQIKAWNEANLAVPSHSALSRTLGPSVEHPHGPGHFDRPVHHHRSPREAAAPPHAPRREEPSLGHRRSGGHPSRGRSSRQTQRTGRAEETATERRGENQEEPTHCEETEAGAGRRKVRSEDKEEQRKAMLRLRYKSISIHRNSKKQKRINTRPLLGSLICPHISLTFKLFHLLVTFLLLLGRFFLGPKLLKLDQTILNLD